VTKYNRRGGGGGSGGGGVEVYVTVLHLFYQVAFGIDLNSLEDEHTPFPKAIANCLKGLMMKLRNPLHKVIQCRSN
jgi:hypothetical protein